jgi:hypothetical protein
MSKTKQATTMLSGAVGFWGMSTVMAHAYLDPAAGSFFLQMLIGGIAGGLVVLKMYWAKAKAFITGQNRAHTAKD